MTELYHFQVIKHVKCLCASLFQVFQSNVCQLVTKCITLMCDPPYKHSMYLFNKTIIDVHNDLTGRLCAMFNVKIIKIGGPSIR